MQPNRDRDSLALERTLMAAERTFSAWIRTGLAAVGGGLAIARAMPFQDITHPVTTRVVGGLLVIWGACIFVFAIFAYRRACDRLSHEGMSKTSLTALTLITAMLLVVSAVIFWIIL